MKEQKISKKDLGTINILDILVTSSLAPSKSEARRLVEGNGISINSEKITNPNELITEELFKDNFLVLSKGKKNHIKIVIEQ